MSKTTTSSTPTSYHQFFASPTIRLRHQSFDIRFDDESRSGNFVSTNKLTIHFQLPANSLPTMSHFLVFRSARRTAFASRACVTVTVWRHVDTSLPATTPKLWHCWKKQEQFHSAWPMCRSWACGGSPPTTSTEPQTILTGNCRGVRMPLTSTHSGTLRNESNV